MKTAFAVVAFAGVAAVSNANLIISEVVDATLPGGLPKFVELTNTGNTSIDLSQYSIGNINNDGTSLGFDSLVLSGTLAAGDSYVISYEAGDSAGDSTFFDVYGFDADNLAPGSFINGDDRLVLFFGPALVGDAADGNGATVVDIYGVAGVDGTGEAWEYTDGYSFRNFNVTVGNGGSFVESEWTIGGVNSLETGDDNEELALILANTTPGTHSFIPTPGTAALLALAGFAARRRRNG